MYRVHAIAIAIMWSVLAHLHVGAARLLGGWETNHNQNRLRG